MTEAGRAQARPAFVVQQAGPNPPQHKRIGYQRSVSKSADQPTPASPQRLSHDLVVIIAESTTIVGILSFAASALVHTIIFAKWGLPYLQIASPSDVLMGGIGVAVGVTPTLVGFALGLLAAKTLPRIFIAFTPAVAFLLAAFLYIVRTIYGQPKHEETHSTIIEYSIISGIIAFLLSSFAASVGLIFRKFFIRWSEAAAFGPINPKLARDMFLWSMMGVILFSSISELLSRIHETGLIYPSPTLGHKADTVCEDPKVLWLGGSAVVGECESYRFAIRGDGTVLRAAKG